MLRSICGSKEEDGVRERISHISGVCEGTGKKRRKNKGKAWR